MALLSLAMLLAIWLVIAFLFNQRTATIVDVAFGVLAVVLWVGPALRTRSRLR